MDNKGEQEIPPKNFITKEGFPKEVYSKAVHGLISIAILAIAGAVIIHILSIYTENNQSYEGLLTLASAAVGGLVGIFANQNSN